MNLLKKQASQGTIDLYYGDESRVCEKGYVPYGWQYKHEKVGIPACHGKGINCFGLLSAANHLVFKTTTTSVDADFVLEQLELFSFSLKKQTVVVLDNARVHTSKKIKERLLYWQQRGLYIFYLPPYSPHLNIIERLWLELKARWLRPQDYKTAQSLFLATTLALGSVGKELIINFVN